MVQVSRFVITKFYEKLLESFGPQKWWPGETPFEIIVGAILTQNTNWENVERAILNLKKARVLTPTALYAISIARLAGLIRPAGYFNIKAKRLKNFLHFFFNEYKGSFEAMSREEAKVLREKLLHVNGIGPETADSILLYALNKPIFVVDAYTKRIFYRHNMILRDAEYHAVQNVFESGLDKDVRMFNEYHALIVRLGKEFCRPRPRCEKCPLNQIHYSLIYKCRICHRALLDRKARSRTGNSPSAETARSSQLICRECSFSNRSLLQKESTI